MPEHINGLFNLAIIVFRYWLRYHRAYILVKVGKIARNPSLFYDNLRSCGVPIGLGDHIMVVNEWRLLAIERIIAKGYIVDGDRKSAWRWV